MDLFNQVLCCFFQSEVSVQHHLIRWQASQFPEVIILCDFALPCKPSKQVIILIVFSPNASS